MDLRQTLGWAKYLESIGWQAQILDSTLVLIRKIPLFGSVIKIQRPKYPIPFDKIEQIAKKYQALFVLIEPEVNNFDEAEFKKRGFKQSNLTLTHTSTIQIDLTHSPKKLWQSISENARRNIKKAQNQNLIIKTFYLDKEYSPNILEMYFALSRSLIAMKNFYLPGKVETTKKLEALKDSTIILFAYQNPADQPIASIWLTGHQDVISYVQTGITKLGYELLANYLLVWEGLKISQNLGYRKFDFEGIFDSRFPKERKKWIGFSEFKKRFHGTEINYPPPFIKIYNPLIRLLFFFSEKFN